MIFSTQGFVCVPDIYDVYNLDKNETQIQYLGNECSLSKEGISFDLNSDGSFSINGISQDIEYDDNGSLHIGNTNMVDKDEDGPKLMTNWFNCAYLGPNNPKKNEKYSYSFPPVNDLDYAAYQHDRGYDKVGASGIIDATLNWSTVDYDYKLVEDCRKIMQNRGRFAYKGKVLATSIVFGAISYEKACNRQKANNPNRTPIICR